MYICSRWQWICAAQNISFFSRPLNVKYISFWTDHVIRTVQCQSYRLQQCNTVPYNWATADRIIYIIKGDMCVCLSVCLFVPYGRPNGWANRDETWHTHSCPPRECFWQDQCQGHSRMPARVTEVWNTRNATPSERRAHYVRTTGGGDA